MSIYLLIHYVSKLDYINLVYLIIYLILLAYFVLLGLNMIR